MKATGKKNTNDYPTLKYRVTDDEFKEITGLINEVVERLKSRSDEEEPVVKKGDVAVAALRIGLKALKKMR